MIANDRNRARWLVLGLSQNGACTDLYENHSENSLTEDLSNDTTVNPPLFSLVNTFKVRQRDKERAKWRPKSSSKRNNQDMTLIVSADGSQRGGMLGVGVRLCICVSGVSFLCVHYLQPESNLN